jgi:hypothetical protein
MLSRPAVLPNTIHGDATRSYVDSVYSYGLWYYSTVLRPGGNIIDVSDPRYRFCNLVAHVNESSRVSLLRQIRSLSRSVCQRVATATLSFPPQPCTCTYRLA